MKLPRERNTPGISFNVNIRLFFGAQRGSPEAGCEVVAFVVQKAG